MNDDLKEGGSQGTSDVPCFSNLESSQYLKNFGFLIDLLLFWIYSYLKASHGGEIVVMKTLD